MTTIDTGASYAKPHTRLQRDVVRYFEQKGWIAVTELDLGSRSLDKEVKRADVFAMSPMYPPQFVICEVKVSWPDFQREIQSEKYMASMENCDLFYFVTDYALVELAHIPEWCGWLEQWKNKKGFTEHQRGEENRQFKMNDELWFNLVKKLG